MRPEEEAGYEAGRAEFFLVCRGDPDAEKCWPKAAAAIGAAMGPFQTKIETQQDQIEHLKAEVAELREWLRLVGRDREEAAMADRA